MCDGIREDRSFFVRRLPSRPVWTLAILALVVLVGACQTPSIPLSAQLGSTIVLPIEEEFASGNSPIGYGGTEYSDQQRGQLVFQLAGTSPTVELTTRFSVLASAHPASEMAGEPQNSFDFYTQANPVQILSVVDVWPAGFDYQTYDPNNPPPGFPSIEGTYDVDVVWRREGESDVPGPEYNGQIQILPFEVQVQGPAGPETIRGAPTPAERWACNWGNCGFGSIGVLHRMIPRPRLDVRVLPQAGQPAIAAFEIELSYPAAEIDLVEAFQDTNIYLAPNDAPTIWLDDDEAGSAKIGVLSHPDASPSPWRLQVVFDLVGSLPLDLGAGTVQVTSLTAYDANGGPVAAGATLQGIR